MAFIPALTAPSADGSVRRVWSRKILRRCPVTGRHPTSKPVFFLHPDLTTRYCVYVQYLRGRAAEQLLDENIRSLQQLSDLLNDEVMGAMVDNHPAPETLSYREIILGITVLLPKLRRARSVCVPSAAARAGVCEHCE